MTDESGISEGGYTLVVAFPDQSPSFAHGVEVGKLWARMDSAQFGDAVAIASPTMAVNREVLRRIAEYLGYKVEIAPSEIEGWDQSTFTKIKPERTRPNPHGLRVVST